MKKKLSQEEQDDLNQRTTAAGLARYATEYLHAAILVERHLQRPQALSVIAPTPAYFLALHSIELIFKAYLRYTGVSASDLGNRYGHDVLKLRAAAMKAGLGSVVELDDYETGVVESLVKLNRDHALRYIRTGAKQVADWDDITDCALKLQNAIAPLTGFRALTFD